jgi:hypothetical protein
LALLTDVIASGQIEHLLAVHTGIEAEVEAVQRLGAVHAGAAHPQRQLLLGAACHLIFQQAGEKLDVAPLAVNGLAVTRFQGLQHTRQAQALEIRC